MLESLFEDHIRVQYQRVDDALNASGLESLAIYAGGTRLQFLDDQPYPFKANPHFKLFAPLADPLECWIVYRLGQKLQLIFWQPVDYWHKPPSLPSGYWTNTFDIQVIREPAQAHSFVSKQPRCAFIGEWNSRFEDWGFAQVNPAALLERLHFSRAIKTAYEAECMRRSSRIAAAGHRAAESSFREGGTEYDIHFAYLKATQHTDNELPYPSIVALNANGSVLHYQHLERERAPQRYSLLIDAGAQFAGYASDITRTYSWADDEFATLIQEMHRMQLALCQQVRSGTDYAAIHLDAHFKIAQLLHDVGLISASASDAVQSGLSSVFFPHGVGHLLGLQVHDVAGFTIDEQGTTKDKPSGHPYLRLTRSLAPGFIVTIEPGIYFIESLLQQARSSTFAELINWNAVERFKPCGGIRIEDDVMCTDAEPENLTRDAFAACL